MERGDAGAVTGGGPRARGRVAHQGALLVIGDSLTVGATSMGGFSSRLRSLAAWDEVVIDARVGRSARIGAGVLARRLTGTVDVGAVVVALGTNDMAGYRDSAYARWLIDEVMTRARDLPVMWINLEFAATPRPDRKPRGVRFNTQLGRAAERWPNLKVSDWNGWFTPRGDSRFVADGMHLTATGYRARSTFMVEEIARFARWIETGGTTTTAPAPTTASTTTALPPSTTAAPEGTTPSSSSLTTATSTLVLSTSASSTSIP